MVDKVDTASPGPIGAAAAAGANRIKPGRIVFGEGMVLARAE